MSFATEFQNYLNNHDGYIKRSAQGAFIERIASLESQVASAKKSRTMIKVGRFYKLTPLGNRILTLMGEGKKVELAVRIALQEQKS